MGFIKNAILTPLQTLIGVAPAPQPVVVDLNNISLTMPVFPHVARRALSSAATGGWFVAVMENVHSVADDEASFINPYLAGSAALAPYPAAVRPGFDIWLLGINGQRSSGAGGLTGAALSINTTPGQEAFAIDDAGAPVAASGPRVVLAQFDSISTLTAGIVPPMVTEQGLTYQPANIRIPRGGVFNFHSTSAAAAEFQMILTLGLFPAGLGQDVAA